MRKEKGYRYQPWICENNYFKFLTYLRSLCLKNNYLIRNMHKSLIKLGHLHCGLFYFSLLFCISTLYLSIYLHTRTYVSADVFTHLSLFCSFVLLNFMFQGKLWERILFWNCGVPNRLPYPYWDGQGRIYGEGYGRCILPQGGKSEKSGKTEER